MAVNGDENRYGDQQDSPSDVGRNIKDLNNQFNNAKNTSDVGKGVGEAAKTGAEMANTAANTAASTAATTAATAGAEIAADAAAGSALGPVGTAVGAVWGARHTIVKVLGAVGIFFLVIVCFFFSLPSIVTNGIFGFDGSNNDENQTIESYYAELADAIQEVIDDAYADAVEKSKKMIKDGGYDYDISLLNLTDNAKNSANYDVANILATYSVMVGEDEEVSKSDMINKLKAHKNEFFPISSEEKTEVTLVPAEYWTYTMQNIPVVTSKRQTGTIDGVPQYEYRWAYRDVYQRDELLTAEEEMEVDYCIEAIVETGTVDNYFNTLVNVHNYSCYLKNGTITVSPTEVETKYLAVTIGSFNSSVLQTAFDYDPDALYADTKQTNAEVVAIKTEGLKALLYGSYGTGSQIPLTDAELLAILNSLECNDLRKSLVATGLSLVGKVPYFWGGKSPAGWNDEWWQPKLVTAAGNSTTGTIQPYGLDCTGFTDWTFKTTVGFTLYGSDKYIQIRNCYPIPESELKSGDLGFLVNPDGTQRHALLFVCYDENGNRVWVHCTSPDGVIVNTPSYDYKIKTYRPNGFDYGD